MTIETLTPAELGAAERVLRHLLRTDFCAFAEKTFGTVCPGQTFSPNWHLEAIGHALERVVGGETKRLIILMPPRNLKSICASVALPAWLLGRDPTRQIICVSYSTDLAGKHARDCRAVMMAPWYQAYFPSTRIDAGKTAETEFMTTQRGFRLATSTGGTLTGRGGDILIIDDPMKPADAQSEARRLDCQQWYSNTLLSRLDDKVNGAIVLVMQRLHVDDLAGYLHGAGRLGGSVAAGDCRGRAGGPDWTRPCPSPRPSMTSCIPSASRARRSSGSKSRWALTTSLPNTSRPRCRRAAT